MVTTKKVTEAVEAETVKKCPSCGTALDFPEQVLGRMIACPFCGKPLVFEDETRNDETREALSNLVEAYGLKLLVKVAKKMGVVPTAVREKGGSKDGNAATCADSFTDPRDGETYRTITIDGVTWLAENLRYRCKGSYSLYDDSTYDANCGRLYTYDAALKRAAPRGWHVATADEWRSLLEYAEKNGVGDAATVLMSKVFWDEDEITPTDDFGFGIIPVGYRNEYEEYIDENPDDESKITKFWAMPSDTENAIAEEGSDSFLKTLKVAAKKAPRGHWNSFRGDCVDVSGNGAEIAESDKEYGLSLRLVKD